MNEATNRFLVLVVSDVFEFSDGRLVLLPDFPTDRDLNRDSFPATAEIVSPLGDVQRCTLSIHLTHFNIPSSTDVNERWRYVVELHEIEKSKVPLGSSVYVFCPIWR